MSPFARFRRPLTVSRKSLGAYVNGIWVQNEDYSFTILASVQPATPEDLQSLPENRRTLTAYRIYTDTQLLSALEGVRNPDTMTINDEEYEIAQVGVWQNGVINHYKCLAVRVQP
jgi:hypothetical protein